MAHLTAGMLASYIIITGVSGSFAEHPKQSVGIAVIPKGFRVLRFLRFWMDSSSVLVWCGDPSAPYAFEGTLHPAFGAVCGTGVQSMGQPCRSEAYCVEIVRLSSSALHHADEG